MEPANSDESWRQARYIDQLISHRTCRSSRKRRLLACAAVRSVFDLLPDESFRQWVDVAESYAEGVIGATGLRSARWKARKAVKELGARGALEFHIHATSARVCVILLDERFEDFKMALESASDARGRACGDLFEESTKQTDWARDIFVNPFLPTPQLDPHWLTWRSSTLPRLAQEMYDARDFSSMPILADAMEEAGAGEEWVCHCREPRSHVRGCWVVDMLLGKP